MTSYLQEAKQKDSSILALVPVLLCSCTLHVLLSLTEATVQHVRHHPTGPQRPRIAHHRVLWSEWIVRVGGRLKCSLLLWRQDDVAAIEVDGRACIWRQRDKAQIGHSCSNACTSSSLTIVRIGLSVPSSR